MGVIFCDVKLHFRIAFLPPTEMLNEAYDRIEEFVRMRAKKR